MEALIQYPLPNGNWSNWTTATIENEKLMVDGHVLETPLVRVIKDNHPDNPNVAWYIFHEDHLYQATKSKTGYIEKATPVENKSLKPIAIEKLSGDFSLKAFDEMLDAAKEYLAPPILTLADIQELLVRPADTVQTINLMATETAEQRAQNWWKDLVERYRQDVEARLIDIVSQPLTRKQQLEALTTFLSEHHQFIQGTCLDYIAIPNHPVTRALSEIATRLATKETSAIEILMPGVAVESIKDAYANLSDLPLSDALQSHIALTPQYWMPVRSLNEYIEHPSEPLYSPYCFDDFIPYQATSEDIKALFEHSESTRHLRDAFGAYQALLMQDDSLLGQLNILGQKLKLYDAHGGIGKGVAAASGAYPAIMNFMQYYLNLEPCTLSMTDTPPKLEDLPEKHHIGYVFYGNQLYFLNRYENTIAPITEPNHPAKFGIYLARFHALKDMPHDIKTPMIIKTDDGQYTFIPENHPIDASVIDINFPLDYQRIIPF